MNKAIMTGTRLTLTCEHCSSEGTPASASIKTSYPPDQAAALKTYRLQVRDLNDRLEAENAVLLRRVQAGLIESSEIAKFAESAKAKFEALGPPPSAEPILSVTECPWCRAPWDNVIIEKQEPIPAVAEKAIAG